MDNLTLKQIQLKLNVPQHVLIHLCEKGVITPDITETKGRGQHREFSNRNLFEFAVALELRKYQIPILVVKAIIQLLSSFEHNAKKANSKFHLPKSILKPNPVLLLFIERGERLVIGMGKELIFEWDLATALKSGKVKFEKLKDFPKNSQSCLQINLSEIAEKSLI